MPLSLNVKLGRRSSDDVVGLDIQPGLVAAVQARVNGALVAERAGALALPSDAVREGDVVDEQVLSETLRELFARNKLSRRVRVGVANQRTVMRTIELPPITDQKELDAAVRFQAQDQVPMPLNNAVLDYLPLGVVDTPAGPRQHVVVVAAQRDMIERLLAAVRAAGLSPVGVDLSAFALIRSLYRRDPDHAGRVLYLNVDGLTNVAIAEGTVCRFTRVVGGGVEELASELATRRSIPTADARVLLAAVDLSAEVARPRPPLADPHDALVDEPHPPPPPDADVPLTSSPAGVRDALHDTEAAAPSQAPGALAPHESHEHAGEVRAGAPPAPAAVQPASVPWDAEAQAVLENGIRAISGEVRNSLDFHRSQGGGGDVSRVVLSGFVLDFRGFAEALQAALGLEVHAETISLVEPSLAQSAPVHRLAVAAGLAATEAPQ
jgi:type IV pilus assembly protein PilM